MWGAQGCANSSGKGGKGGYSSGNYNGNGSLYVCVGGQTTGYNGGGLQTSHGQNGGGATHFATTNRGVLSSYKNYQSEILLVAGGGGAANDLGVGGAGGGTSGGAGSQITYSDNVVITGGTGGTQSSGGTFSGSAYSNDSRVIVNGSFGQGGYSTARSDFGGCGGGGWYGGNASGGGEVSHDVGGGGGSGYIGGLTNGRTIAGNASMPSPTGGTETGHYGNGYAVISWHPNI